MAWWDNESWSEQEKQYVIDMLSQIDKDLGLHSRRLGRIENRLNILKTQGDDEMATLQELVTEVEDTKGVVASVQVAFAGLTTKIEELKAALEAAVANNDPAAVQTAIDGLNEIQATLTALVPAVVENPDPVVDPPPVDPVDPPA